MYVDISLVRISKQYMYGMHVIFLFYNIRAEKNKINTNTHYVLENKINHRCLSDKQLYFQSDEIYKTSYQNIIEIWSPDAAQWISLYAVAIYNIHS